MLLLFFDIELYELFVYFGNKALLVTSFVSLNIFSQFVGCLFILSVVSFAMQKLKSLIRFHLFLLLFLWGARPKKILLVYVRRLSLSSGSFMVLCLIFNSFSRSGFTFMYGVRKRSNSFTHGCPAFARSLAEEPACIVCSCLIC